jgi:hypothetical protein
MQEQVRRHSELAAAGHAVTAAATAALGANMAYGQSAMGMIEHPSAFQQQRNQEQYGGGYHGGAANNNN